MGIKKHKPIVLSKIKIKRNDQVIVIAGKDKGKTGRVLRVVTDKNRVIVEGAGMIKKHVKPNPQANVRGGIVEQEAAIHISNVQLLDSDGKGSRVGFQMDGEKKTRITRTNGASAPEPKAQK